MFIHYGLYSIVGHQEWVLECEGIPIGQYEGLAHHFYPKPRCAREWARQAKRAGQRYMVLTTKHYEGFCLWDTKLTDYNAARQGARRDIVREFVEAARERFVTYTHGLIRELMTDYSKIDILWYDVDWPLTPAQWRSEEMNRMVFDLQPDIMVNNRNGLPGDFSTPEHKIQPDKRAWESCETMNLGWGWQRADTEWKSPRSIINSIATCAQQGGNFLLNIGPEPDGSVPSESVRILNRVGDWLSTNGAAIYGTEGGASVSFGNYDNFTRRGNTLYVHVYFWPSGTYAAQWVPFFQPPTVIAIGGVRAKVLSAKLLQTGQPVQFTQDDLSVRLTGLPSTPPDDPTTVFALECDKPPVVDHSLIRSEWRRLKVNISS